MSAEKKKAPVLPKRQEPEEEPDFLYPRSKKYNVKGDIDTYVPLDDKGVPLIVLPSKRKK